MRAQAPKVKIDAFPKSKNRRPSGNQKVREREGEGGKEGKGELLYCNLVLFLRTTWPLESGSHRLVPYFGEAARAGVLASNIPVEPFYWQLCSH
jgi:hypothetical protein